MERMSMSIYLLGMCRKMLSVTNVRNVSSNCIRLPIQLIFCILFYIYAASCMPAFSYTDNLLHMILMKRYKYRLFCPKYYLYVQENITYKWLSVSTAKRQMQTQNFIVFLNVWLFVSVVVSPSFFKRSELIYSVYYVVNASVIIISNSAFSLKGGLIKSQSATMLSKTIDKNEN